MNTQSATKSQVDVCYHKLRRLIVKCTIKPGARLTEQALRNRLGFGRTPVREALLRLIQDRLIEARPRSGYQVRPLTRDSIDAFFVAWRAIAPGIAKVAFERMSESLREELYDLGVEYQLIDEDDLKESLRLSVRMFDILVMAANNEPLTYIYHRLGAEMERVFLTFFETPAGREWRNPKSQMFIKLATITDPHTAAARIDSKLAEAHRSFLAYIDSRAKAGDPLVLEK